MRDTWGTDNLQPNPKSRDLQPPPVCSQTLKTGGVVNLLKGTGKATLILWVFGAKTCFSGETPG